MANEKLNEAQRDGRACVACGGESGPMAPVGTRDGVQVFECAKCSPRSPLEAEVDRYVRDLERHASRTDEGELRGQMLDVLRQSVAFSSLLVADRARVLGALGLAQRFGTLIGEAGLVEYVEATTIEQHLAREVRRARRRDDAELAALLEGARAALLVEATSFGRALGAFACIVAESLLDDGAAVLNIAPWTTREAERARHELVRVSRVPSLVSREAA